MRTAIYRLVLNLPQRPANVRPLLRFAVPVSASETVIEVKDLSVAEDGNLYYLAVPVGASAAVYFGEIKADQDEDSVIWSDPIAVAGSEAPSKPRVTPVGKLYWVECTDAKAVPAKPEPVAPVVVEAVVAPVVVEPTIEPVVEPATEPVVEPVAEEPQAVEPDAAETERVAQIPVDVDPVAVVEAVVEPVTEPVAELIVEPTSDEDELVEYLAVESFSELDAEEKRDYLREIGIDGPVDMRSNSRMVQGYRNFLATLEDADE